MREAHVTAAMIDRYLSGALPMDESMVIADHLFLCSGCRSSALQNAGLAGRVDAVRTAFAASPHLEFEELVRWNRGERLDDAAAGHLASCANCAEEARDLATVQRQLASRPIAWRRWLVAAAALIVLIGGLLVFRARSRVVESPAPQVVRTTAPRQAPPPRVARPVLTIVDRSGTIELAAGGAVTGLPADPAFSALAAAVLTSRTLSVAPLPAVLSESASALRGSAASTGVELHEPLGAVVSARPQFGWSNTTPGPAQVKVFDENGSKVAESAPLEADRWRPRIALERGRTYTWQLTVGQDDSESIHPQPPAPPARFFVVGRNEAEAIDAMRASGSHLLLAIAYARAGLKPEARAELLALQKLNPG
jgi:hypothetical protein